MHITPSRNKYGDFRMFLDLAMLLGVVVGTNIVRFLTVMEFKSSYRVKLLARTYCDFFMSPFPAGSLLAF